MLELPAHITLEMPGAGCELAAECDPEKMEIVFMNLLVNAVQAIGSRAGRITVRARDDGGGHVVVEFENSGSHIPEEDMPLVFEPMFTTKMQGDRAGPHQLQEHCGAARRHDIRGQRRGSGNIYNTPPETAGGWPRRGRTERRFS